MKDDFHNEMLIGLIREARSQCRSSNAEDIVKEFIREDSPLMLRIVTDRILLNRLIAKGLRKTMRELRNRDREDWQ
jgi:hypothetical protein